jgi:uroporphyrinogen-III synthase
LTDHGDQAALVLVTRPQETGSKLAARLRDAGRDALWWPAFDLLPPEDPFALKARIARLADFDLVIFVSPAAVHAFASAFRRMYRGTPQHAWPRATRIAAVGAATREAALETLPGAREATIICPAGDTAAEGGTEALVTAIKGLAARPQSVLVVRAQRGRQRLLEWLQGHGAGVEEAVAYRRLPHEPGAAPWAVVQSCLARGGRLAVLYTSTEAVAVVAQQFAREPGHADAWADAIALAVHERIERELRGRGFTDVRRCAMDVASILQALPAAPAPPPSATTSVDLLL